MLNKRLPLFARLLAGLGANESDLDPKSPDYLSVVLRRREFFLRRSQVFWRSSLLGLLASIVFIYLFSEYDQNLGVARLYISPVIGFVAALFAVGTLSTNISQAKQDVEDILSEIDLKSISLEQRETRAQKLFQLHQRELKRYYDQSLAQGRWIFMVGIVCLILGFTVVGLTLYEVLTNSSATVTDKIIIGVVGAVSGILTNFIAAIYMKMFGDTVKSATEFHNRLVATHHLHFGNFLISKIDDIKLRDEALAEVSRAIASTKQGGAGLKNGKSKDGNEKKQEARGVD
jgi:hypothetical protein